MPYREGGVRAGQPHLPDMVKAMLGAFRYWISELHYYGNSLPYIPGQDPPPINIPRKQTTTGKYAQLTIYDVGVLARRGTPSELHELEIPTRKGNYILNGKMLVRPAHRFATKGNHRLDKK